MFDIKMESIADAPMAPGQWKASGAASDLAERLTALGQMTHTELRDEWRRLYRAHPPKKISRDLLELAVAWKLQEKALGGPGDLLENPEVHLPRAAVIRPVYPERAGIVQAIATRDLGVAVVSLGGGRTRPEDEIDHGVGLDALATIGSRVDGDVPLAFVHARDDSAADAAARAVLAAYRVGNETQPERPLVIERVEDEKP